MLKQDHSTFSLGGLMIAWRVQEAEVKLFRSFLPQLCKRTANHDFAAIVKFMPKDFYIEEKMDGERIQLHKRGNEYFYCSR
jgi:DNA ligase-4